MFLSLSSRPMDGGASRLEYPLMQQAFLHVGYILAAKEQTA